MTNFHLLIIFEVKYDVAAIISTTYIYQATVLLKQIQ